MLTKATTATRNANGEEGFVLLGVLFLVVVMLIWLAVAAPKVATEIRRDKELELYHRGMQYTRAIRLYYKKFGAYPISLDQLENSNNMRFLRKRYNDPFTGKPDWRLIHVGEARVQQTGLLGQPAGVAAAGNSPGQGNLTPVGISQPGVGPGGAAGDPTANGGAAGLGASTLTSSTGSPIGSAGPIIGIASTVKKESIREYQKQKHYNEWEFVYNPQADLGGLGGATGQGVLPQGGASNANPFAPSAGVPPGSPGAQPNPGIGLNPPANPPNSNPPTDPNNPSNPNQPPPN